MSKVNTYGGAKDTKDEGRPLRITRARARALGGIPPYSRPSFKNEQKNVNKASSKRAASENKTSAVVPDALRHKRRAVLKDVSNVSTTSHDNPIKASKFQVSLCHLV